MQRCSNKINTKSYFVLTTDTIQLTLICELHCSAVITRSIFSQIFTKVFCFVDPASDWYSAIVTLVIHVISYTIGPRYNGTQLYVVSAEKILKKFYHIKMASHCNILEQIWLPRATLWAMRVSLNMKRESHVNHIHKSTASLPNQQTTCEFDGFVQDCCNSITNASDLLQSCTKPSI